MPSRFLDYPGQILSFILIRPKLTDIPTMTNPRVKRAGSFTHGQPVVYCHYRLTKTATGMMVEQKNMKAHFIRARQGGSFRVPIAVLKQPAQFICLQKQTK